MKNVVTLKLNKEYKRAYFQGKYKAHPYVVTYLIKNRLGVNRIGITTSKKIGKAVERNRARRVIRAAYLSIREEISFPAGYDLVFVARPQTPYVKSTQIAKVMKKQISLLLNSPNNEKSRSPRKETEEKKES